MSTSDFRVSLPDGWAGALGGNGLVYGTGGFQDISILSGNLSFDASFNKGGDIIRFPGAAASYTVARSGSSAQIISGSQAAATIPMGTVGTVTSFGDGVRKLVYTAGSFSIGGQPFSSTNENIAAAADGTALPTGADSAAIARVSLAGNVTSSQQVPTVKISGKAVIYGTSSIDVIAVDSSRTTALTFDASFNKGGDLVVLDKPSSDYYAAKSGSSVTITTTNMTLTIPVGTVGLTLRFSDGDKTLVFASNAIKIGDQVVGANSTPLTSSSISLSLDVGTLSSTEILSGAGGKTTFTDDASKNSFVRITNLSADDVLRIVGATDTDYSFSSGDLDGDGAADDLSIAFNNLAAGVLNDIKLLSVVKEDAFVFDRATAIAAVGFNFITFG